MDLPSTAYIIKAQAGYRSRARPVSASSTWPTAAGDDAARPIPAYDAFGVFRTPLPQKIGVFHSSKLPKRGSVISKRTVAPHGGEGPGPAADLPLRPAARSSTARRAVRWLPSCCRTRASPARCPRRGESSQSSSGQSWCARHPRHQPAAARPC